MDLYLLYLWGQAWGSQNGACPPPGRVGSSDGTRSVCVCVGASPWAPSLPAPGAPLAPAHSLQRRALKRLLFIWLFAAPFCGETLGLTQVCIKHHCHSRSFKIANRWKKSRQDGCALITHVRQGDLLWHTVLSQSPI